MIVYDEDAFWGGGEYEVLTASEIVEYLTDEEREIFDSLCDRAEKRRQKAEYKKHREEIKMNCLHRGYGYARLVTNSYRGRKDLSYSLDFFDYFPFEEELF